MSRHNITLEPEVYDEFCKYAGKQRIKVSTWINQQMENFIEEQKDWKNYVRKEANKLGQNKFSLIKKNALGRHENDVDRDVGISVMNDFLQLSKMLERLKESDLQAFHTLFCLIEERLKLEEEKKERGKRIAKLQKK